MSESRKLNIDGGVVRKDDEPAATYKPVPELDTEFKPAAKATQADKDLYADGADEKLLNKEQEVKILTRVDMADAKYIVGDHRNGDAKIEIDANKRQFSGLTKEELMKYADDPFWVRLRWAMFVLFWVMWFLMLAGAVFIIVRAPKCTTPLPKTWYEKGPLVDVSEITSMSELEGQLKTLSKAQVKGAFVSAALVGDTYSVLDENTMMDDFKTLATKAKELGVRLIVDLTANFVHKSHDWFLKSEKKEKPYDDYFIWRSTKKFDPESGVRKQPNNWVSTLNQSAWVWSEARGQYYLQQFGPQHPDLNMRNNDVVALFDQVLKKWMAAGASGVRLLQARQLLVSEGFEDEEINTAAKDSVTGFYTFYQHRHTSDQPDLAERLLHWGAVVDSAGETGETVFTVKDATEDNQAFVYNGTMAVRPPSSGLVNIGLQPKMLAARINKLVKLGYWPTVQFDSEPALAEAVSSLALLLPASPVLTTNQLFTFNENGTRMTNDVYKHMVQLRNDQAILHGNTSLKPISNDTLLACVRWKSGHSGYAVVLNTGATAMLVNATALPELPETVAVVAFTQQMKAMNVTRNANIATNNITVQPESAIVLSFVPIAAQ